MNGDGADEDGAEPCLSVDFHHDDCVVGIEEVVVNAEHELLVPHGVGVTLMVNLGGESAVWVDPAHSVGPNRFGDLGQILGRNHVDF